MYSCRPDVSIVSRIVVAERLKLFSTQIGRLGRSRSCARVCYDTCLSLDLGERDAYIYLQANNNTA